MADRYVLSVNTKPEIRDRLDRLAAPVFLTSTFFSAKHLFFRVCA